MCLLRAYLSRCRRRRRCPSRRCFNILLLLLLLLLFSIVVIAYTTPPVVIVSSVRKRSPDHFRRTGNFFFFFYVMSRSKCPSSSRRPAKYYYHYSHRHRPFPLSPPLSLLSNYCFRHFIYFHSTRTGRSPASRPADNNEDVTWQNLNCKQTVRILWKQKNFWSDRQCSNLGARK